MTTPAVHSEPSTAGAPASQAPSDLLRAVMAESRELTAVERFAKAHEAGTPEQAKYYRDLIPAAAPESGQQYAFDVDLDACSGCKACVSACHHLNGLETDETWRWVGQLYGAAEPQAGGLPIIQHVTTACHHCVDPGCLAGCPTNAYEKDPETGIVRHLDDQCFGCQYCTMACPYEVPQYSASKGIVRKCDMCHGRLAAGEAPACVQSCPNQAIRIAVVDVAETVARTDEGEFLPDSPPAELTHPATIYRTERGLPATAVGADYDSAKPQHAHPPLVAMLVLTQLSVGAVGVALLMRLFGGDSAAVAATTTLGTLAGLAGLGLAPLHLGRPHLAFRSVLGWRHSWLSREAIVFGLFAPLAIGATVFALLPYVVPWLPGNLLSLIETFVPPGLRTPVELSAVLAGAAGIYCSARIYQFTGRTFWLGWRTLAKFATTALVMGSVVGAACSHIWNAGPASLTIAALAALLAKVLIEQALLRSEPESDLRHTLALHRGQLRSVSAIRNACAAMGAACLLAALLGFLPGGLTIAIAVFGAASMLLGELAERWLYFSAVVPLRMPGGFKS